MDEDGWGLLVEPKSPFLFLGSGQFFSIKKNYLRLKGNRPCRSTQKSEQDMLQDKCETIDGLTKKILKANDLIAEMNEALNSERIVNKNHILSLKNEIIVLGKHVTSLTEELQSRDDASLIIRHDIRNLLSSFVLIPQILGLDGNITKEQAEILEKVSESGLKAISLLDMDINLYKICLGKYTFKLDKICGIGLIERVVDQYSTIAANNKITIKWEIISKANRYNILGDENLIYCALGNLIINAIEASPPDSELYIKVDIGTMYAISIRNYGEVPQAIRERFFEKFTTYGKKYGTGIGTYAAKLFIVSQNGEISLDVSIPGQTQVTVKLPLYP